MDQDLTINGILSQNPVLPVLTLQSSDQAVDIVKALQAAGVGAVEIALRTPVALSAIEAVRRQVPDMLVGAGTVRRAEQFSLLNESGAQFAVSPGSTDQLLAEAANWDMPFLPGASSISELMNLCDHNYCIMKLFPLRAIGGAAFLQALLGPLPDIRFCVSGGVDADNYMQYLSPSNVIAVSGSWLTPANLLAEADWDGLTKHASDILARIE